MPFNKYFLRFALLLFVTNFYGQVGIGTTTPSEAAMLDVKSTSDAGATYKGLMPPRVPNVAARDGINPGVGDNGLMVYVVDIGCLQIYNESSSIWEDINCRQDASDLFISEYIEGTKENKAIEIANFTGGPKNLDDYRLGLYPNGSTSRGWGTPLSFNSGVVLQHGEVYVIKNPAEDLGIVADQAYVDLIFNGNDAVTLETRGGDIIDILGTIGSTVIFGETVTFRKKSGIGPSNVYNAGDYDSFGVDVIDGLGWHDY